MSLLTLITALVVLVGVVSRLGYGRALALGAATPAGSALVIGGTALPTFYTVALGVVVALGLTVVGIGRSPTLERRPFPPGLSVMAAFAAWATFVTLIAPLLFDQMPIVNPTSSELIAGVVTSSNIAQITYLVLGVCVAVFIARSSAVRPEILGLAVGTCTMLSLWRYGYTELGVPFPEGLFDNSPSFAFIETAAGGLERVRGILSEPSALAGTSLVTIAYMLPRAALVTGWHRVGALAVAAVALYLGLISTSATFVIGGIAVATIILLVGAVGFFARRSLLSRAVGVIGCLALVGLAFVLPSISAFVGSTVNDKLVSTSYTDRTSANTDSLRVFLDSYGFGVGLGSARASSFAPTLLSATGLIGTLLFTAAVVGLIVRAWPERGYRPVLWALVTLLVVKLAAGPDLSDASGVLWISLGLLSQAVLKRERGEPRAAAPTSVVDGVVRSSA